MHFSLYQNSMVISSVLDCERVWTLTVDIFDLTLTVSFWKIAFLVCCWKQIIMSRSWNWIHLQFSTQCSKWRQCVLCNRQWYLFNIMSVTVLYLGGRFFSGHSVYKVIWNHCPFSLLLVAWLKCIKFSFTQRSTGSSLCSSSRCSSEIHWVFTVFVQPL